MVLKWVCHSRCSSRKEPTMSSELTLKKVSLQIKSLISREAAGHRRSINQEAIVLLEDAKPVPVTDEAANFATVWPGVKWGDLQSLCNP